MTRRIAAVLIGLTAFGAAGAARADGTVELRSSVRVAADAPVTLADLAILTGPDAERLARVVIIEDIASEPTPGAGWLRVGVDRVRDVLGGQPGVNWGRLSLRGVACSVRSAGGPSEPAADADAATAGAPDARLYDPLGHATVRRRVGQRVAEVLGVPESDLRLTFDPGDLALLDTSTAGRTLEIKPAGSSAQIPLVITIYEHDRIVRTETIRVGVAVRRAVLIARTSLRRGELVEGADVSADEQWLTPGTRPGAPERVVGSAVRSRLAAGQVVLESDVQPPVVVQKGDLVWVHCLSDSVLLKRQARAMNTARDGEAVELQSLNSKERFTARMNGRGRAVTIASGGGSQPERNTRLTHSAPETTP